MYRTKKYESVQKKFEFGAGVYKKGHSLGQGAMYSDPGIIRDQLFFRHQSHKSPEYRCWEEGFGGFAIACRIEFYAQTFAIENICSWSWDMKLDTRSKASIVGREILDVNSVACEIGRASTQLWLIPTELYPSKNEMCLSEKFGMSTRSMREIINQRTSIGVLCAERVKVDTTFR